MQYLTLYRKWRPRIFEEVVGQRHVTQTLQNAIRNGNIAHAYLFCGPRGTGKTTTARILAKALNCREGPTPTPCNKCDICEAITEGRAMDVIEMDAASSTSVEDVRDLREKARLAPAQARYKFYIIDEVHRLSRSAFDALLKTLEEPPQNVIFILATTEPNRVPPTIVSRCQRFDFRRGSEEEIKGYLRRVCEGEGIEAEDSALFLVASQAEGSWRDALSLLEQVIAYAGNRITSEDVREVLGLVEEEVFSSLIRSLYQQNPVLGMQLIKEVLEGGKDPRDFLRGLAKYMRDLLFIKIGAEELLEREGDKLEKMREEAEPLPNSFLIQAIETVTATENRLRLSPSPRLPLEIMYVQLLQLFQRTLQPAKIKHAAKEEAQPIPPEVVTQPVGTPQPAAVETPSQQMVPPQLAQPQPSAPSDSSLTFPQLLAQWRKILSILQRESPQVYSFLQHATPVSLEGGILTFGFPPEREFLKKRFDSDSSKHKVLLKAIQKCFPQVSLKFQTTLVEEKEGKEPAPQREEPEELDDNLRLLFSVFPEAKIIKRNGGQSEGNV